MKISLVTLLIGAFVATTPAYAAGPQTRPPIAKIIKAYTGPEGMKVWTLRVGERTENQALVQVIGVDHDWDGVIQKMTTERQGNSTRYSIERNGAKFVALILQDGSGQAYLPGDGREQPVRYSESLSAQGNPEHFLTDYLQQTPR